MTSPLGVPPDKDLTPEASALGCLGLLLVWLGPGILIGFLLGWVVLP